MVKSGYGETSVATGLSMLMELSHKRPWFDGSGPVTYKVMFLVLVHNWTPALRIPLPRYCYIHHAPWHWIFPL